QTNLDRHAGGCSPGGAGLVRGATPTVGAPGDARTRFGIPATETGEPVRAQRRHLRARVAAVVELPGSGRQARERATVGGVARLARRTSKRSAAAPAASAGGGARAGDFQDTRVSTRIGGDDQRQIPPWEAAPHVLLLDDEGCRIDSTKHHGTR